MTTDRRQIGKGVVLTLEQRLERVELRLVEIGNDRLMQSVEAARLLLEGSRVKTPTDGGLVEEFEKLRSEFNNYRYHTNKRLEVLTMMAIGFGALAATGWFTCLVMTMGWVFAGST